MQFRAGNGTRGADPGIPSPSKAFVDCKGLPQWNMRIVLRISDSGLGTANCKRGKQLPAIRNRKVFSFPIGCRSPEATGSELRCGIGVDHSLATVAKIYAKIAVAAAGGRIWQVSCNELHSHGAAQPRVPVAIGILVRVGAGRVCLLGISGMALAAKELEARAGLPERYPGGDHDSDRGAQ